jgi:hypothetical protein
MLDLEYTKELASLRELLATASFELCLTRRHTSHCSDAGREVLIACFPEAIRVSPNFLSDYYGS